MTANRIPANSRLRAIASMALITAMAFALGGCALIGVGSSNDSSTSAGVTNSASQDASPSDSGKVATATTNGPACPATASECASVIVTGDMLFHAGLWSQFALTAATGADATHNFNFLPLLTGQIPYLETADLAVCHLETPLAQFGGPYAGYPVFKIPPEIARTIRSIGYDECTTASNHSMDQGTAGIIWTANVLDSVGLGHTGTYRTEAESQPGYMMYTTASGIKIAVIGGTFSLNGFTADTDWRVDGIDPDTLIAKAKAARAAGADLVFGGFHVGTEYATLPNSQQVALDQALINSGEFDFVYNHHSHSVEPLEYYQGKWIAYSLGNNISETSNTEVDNNEFLVLRLQFAKDATTGTWTTSDVSWAAAVNSQDGKYHWCSVASDSPQGTCVSASADATARSHVFAALNSLGASNHGLHEILITKEQ